jgi:hypothetical protein
MSTTNTTLEEYNAETTDCKNDWCNGPESESLPCFECFDPEREYSVQGDHQHKRRRLISAGEQTEKKTIPVGAI